MIVDELGVICNSDYTIETIELLNYYLIIK